MGRVRTRAVPSRVSWRSADVAVERDGTAVETRTRVKFTWNQRTGDAVVVDRAGREKTRFAVTELVSSSSSELVLAGDDGTVWRVTKRSCNCGG